MDHLPTTDEIYIIRDPNHVTLVLMPQGSRFIFIRELYCIMLFTVEQSIRHLILCLHLYG